MNVGSLFSGIGGLDLGLERAGFNVRWQCEIDPYCRAVLKHHWPDVPCFEDVRQVRGLPLGSVRSGKELFAAPVDLIAGGFPCQPVSGAGKKLAQADPRWLWPEFARVVGELRPRYVLVENVPGLIRRGLDIVVTELASLGYDAEWELVSAASVGAPHLRERLFIVAYASGERRQQVAGSSRRDEGTDGRRSQEDHIATGHGEGDRQGRVPGAVASARLELADPEREAWGSSRPAGPQVFRPEAIERLGRCGGLGDWQRRPLEPGVRLVAHGVPDRLARLRAAGNGVVPQVGEFVGRLILEAAGVQMTEEAAA